MSQQVMWLIERVSVTGWNGPTEYYTGGQLDDRNGLQFPATEDVYQAAAWFSEKAAKKVCSELLGGKAYYWEARDHVFMEDDNGYWL